MSVWGRGSEWDIRRMRSKKGEIYAQRTLVVGALVRPAHASLELGASAVVGQLKSGHWLLGDERRLCECDAHMAHAEPQGTGHATAATLLAKRAGAIMRRTHAIALCGVASTCNVHASTSMVKGE